MKLKGIYRLDYPTYAPDAADDVRPIGHDPDCWVEEQPLGLFFQLAALPKGFFAYIDNDAEQICYEIRTIASLTDQPDYFGFLSPVADNSDLADIINFELQRIEFGYAAGQSPTPPLLIGMRLSFDSKVLTFFNYCDEGYYVFDDTKKYKEFIALYSKVFGFITWVEQPQLFAQLADL